MSGLDRAGYMQISDAVDSKLITSTMGAVTGSWYALDVVSTEAQFQYITAAGMAGSSLITSKTTYALGARFACSKITVVKLSVKDTHGKVIAHNRIVL